MADTNLIVNEIKGSIDTHGIDEKDERLNRTVRTLTAFAFETPIDTSVPILLEAKYREDWVRMYPSFKKACRVLKQDPLTRRAVIFNSTKFYKIFQCFLSIHVIKEKDHYVLIVNQRSSDLAKLPSDINFFKFVASKVNSKTKLNITNLIMNFGSIHYEII